MIRLFLAHLITNRFLNSGVIYSPILLDYIMRKIFFYTLLTGFLFSFHALQAEEVNFEKQIYPLLKESCVKCHRPPYEEKRGTRTRTKKPKAGIILSTKEGITTAVDENDKKILVPGDPAKSRLVEVTKLPLDDEYHFPPEGKAPQWTKKDIALVEKWIKEGAKFGEWSADPKPNEGLEWDGKEKTE